MLELNAPGWKRLVGSSARSSFSPLKQQYRRLYFAFPEHRLRRRRGTSFIWLFDNRVCDRAMALVDPPCSCAAGRDQFTKYQVIPDVVIGRCLMTAFGRAVQTLQLLESLILAQDERWRRA